MNDILHLVAVYELLIKLGSVNIYPKTGRISASTRLFWEVYIPEFYCREWETWHYKLLACPMDADNDIAAGMTT